MMVLIRITLRQQKTGTTAFTLWITFCIPLQILWYPAITKPLILQK